MIGGLIVGLFGIFSLAYLTWMLIKTHNNQAIDESSRIIRTLIVGMSYTFQLGIMVLLSTRGRAYQWFESEPLPEKAGTPYVIGIAVGIFVGAGLLQWLVTLSKKRR